MLARALVLTLALLALAGCAASPPAASRQEQTVDGLTIGFEAVDNARINTSQEFIVTLTDAEGRPVEGADVYLDLTMTQMPMGTNRPVAGEEGGGRYRAQAAYTMVGPWEITVFVELDGLTRQALFTREVVE